jgi:AcrR family transcriptional regulator
MTPTHPRKPRTTDLAVREASARRRELEKEELRETILRAAADLLVEESYELFSLRRLAARIGYSATTVYRYFEDKDQLVFAVLERGFSEFGQRMHQAAAQSYDPMEQLAAQGRTYVRFGLEHPVFYKLMFMTRADYWQKMPPEAFDSKMDSFGLLQRTVAAGMDGGQFRPGNPELVAVALWSQMHGIVSLALTMPMMTPEHVAGATEVAIRNMREGLAAR